MGTCVNHLQDEIAVISGNPRQADAYERSILMYSPNIGPHTSHWKYPVHADWRCTSLANLQEKLPEIRAFVADIVLPYLTRHQMVEAVRDTLLHTPGHSANSNPHEQILAASVIQKNAHRLRDDIRILDARYADYIPISRLAYEVFRDQAVEILRA